MKDHYLLVNLKTGQMDGFYTSKGMAEEVCDIFNEVKGDNWVLTSIEPKYAGKHSLPDNLFHGTSGNFANEVMLLEFFQKQIQNGPTQDGNLKSDLASPTDRSVKKVK